MRTSPHLGVFLAATVTACGGGGAATDADAGPDAGPAGPSCTPVSGERLRLNNLETDGPSIALGFFDDVRDTACSPEVASDGAIRCLPTNPSTGTLAFADAACTERIALPEVAVDPAPPFFRQTRTAESGCGVDTFFSPVTGTVIYAGGQTIYNAVCEAFGAPAGTYYRLGAELAAADFAALELTSLELATRLDYRVYQGDDGARLCSGILHDTAADVDCAISVAEDGVRRCLPNLATVSSVFSDSTCATPATIVIHDATCAELPPPAWAGVTTTGFCDERVRLHSVGPALAPPVYQGAPGTCSAVPLGETRSAHGLGPVHAPFSYAPSQTATTAVGGRLERVEATFEDGLRLVSGYYRDLDLETACSFQNASDGLQHCLPLAVLGEPVATAQSFYGDAACTVVLQVGVLPKLCDETPPRFATKEEGGGLRVFPIDGVTAGPLYHKPAATCLAIDLAASASQHYDLASELTPGAFVSGTEVIE